MANLIEGFRVYVVEDDAAVQKSLCALLGAHGYKTVACTSAEHFLEVFEPGHDACIILDLRLPGMSGMQLQKYLVSNRFTIPIIVVTAHGDVPMAVQAMREGAVDFIEKPALEDPVLGAVSSAHGMLSNQMPSHVPRKIVADRLAKLTAREREVLDHLLEGRLNKEIASELGVSQRTVEVHRARIREKMQARGIADLIRMVG